MKIEKLIDLLDGRTDINSWKISESEIETFELYYIRRELEMNRSKNIHNLEITVYKDFDVDKKHYKGSSLIKIHPTMTKSEILQALDDAIYAAQFAKVDYYPLVQPVKEEFEKITSNFENKPLSDYLPLIVDAIFKADIHKKGSINSTEIFLTKNKTRMINSLGVDYKTENYHGVVEFVTNWKEDKEEIELFRHIDFGEFDGEKLTEDVQEMLEISKARAISENTPALDEHLVILTGDSVKQLLTYYYEQLNAAYIYEKYSDIKIDDSIQGNDVKGDKLTMTLKPNLKGSTFQSRYDTDGVILKEVTIIDEGIAKNYWGNQRFSYYLNMDPTGDLRNIEVKTGEESIESFKKEPYLEIMSFSSFQVDDFTGDFGGEIRLAWYYNGQKTIPVSGGSISGSIKTKHQDMYLSKEEISINNYHGPKHIVLKNVSVSGE